MSDIKLLQLRSGKATELQGDSLLPAIKQITVIASAAKQSQLGRGVQQCEIAASLRSSR